MTDRTIRIEVPVLARVEGEGALELEISNGQLQDLHLRIYEPPRYFEKFLEGRAYTEIPDIVARICGICPVAYQMSAVHAIEDIFNLDPGPWVRSMRRLIYCGEWIESHALHIHLLAAPDFLGFSNVVELAEKYPDEVRRGLKLQNLGNNIIRLLGGRSVHPVGVCTGGFTTAPNQNEIEILLDDLKAGLTEARELIRWSSQLAFPSVTQEFTSVALRHPDEYPMNEGHIVSSTGLDISIDQYREHFIESHMPHSTALHSHLDGKPYLVGPLARLNINYDKLPDEVKHVLAETKIQFPSQNMFHSIIARAAEIYFAMLEAIMLLESYQHPTQSYAEVNPTAGIGYGCTEAPRGILWHRYELAKNGDVTSAEIVPPTSQNQARIEEDLRLSLEALGLDKDDDKLRLHGETVIRNYDPCISCATHFLKIKVKRN
ncbi:MAG: Ni/Fe hydrogenase subunit alpha [Thioalkalispiraceae bacterium]|jgi:coenzyme F420-reducing hydrogenase alpha subunit